jgi:hypothetical protein
MLLENFLLSLGEPVLAPENRFVIRDWDREDLILNLGHLVHIERENVTVLIQQLFEPRLLLGREMIS